MNPPLRLELSIDDQLLRVVRDRHTIRTFAVSTSARGAGFAEGSFQTPFGRFEITEKIGAGMPIYTVFKARKSIGVWSPDQPDNRDLILTRILRLRGLDTENANTWQRYIYLHGTNHEASLGTPTSHGCVRMGNRDIIELSDMIPPGTPLFIHPPAASNHLPKARRKKKNEEIITLCVTSDWFSAHYPPAMSSKTKNTNKGKRYSPAEKKNILAYVEEVNKAKGRGGQKAAAEKFGVSQLTISAWKKASGAPASKKTAAKKPVKKAVAKKAPAKKTKKAAKKPAAKKPVKKAVAKKAPAKKTKKAAKKPAAKKTVKKAAAKKPAGAKNTNKGKRYSASEKQEILDFVAATNAKKGRGGQTAAAAKYGVAALTIAGWIKATGKGAKKPVAKKAAKAPVKKTKAAKKTVKKAPKKVVKKTTKAAKKPTAAFMKRLAKLEAGLAALKKQLA